MNGDERLAVPGPQGEPGKPGAPGTAGLSISVSRALVYLFAVAVFLGGLSLFWSAHEANATRAAIQAADAREQKAQQRAAVILGEKLCITFARLAANKPPPGNPKTNPSRAYDQNNHEILDELGADLGCKAG